ncbi:MAG: hypothetical protein RMK02_08085 [Burkholderiales bacterium]|nr:hypothetical protein [Burkholderiales bacterium]
MRRTSARPPQIVRWTRIRPESRFNGRHAYQGGHAALVELAQLGQVGQRYAHAGRADARHAGQRSRQCAVLAHMRGHVGVAASQFGRKELDDALDAGPSSGVRDAQTLTLRGQHLHELAAAQHQGLQPLQFGIGQRLDEAFTLGVLIQHPGKYCQHLGVQRVGLGQRDLPPSAVPLIRKESGLKVT